MLEALFSGVDLIAESDAGRTFKGFWRLLTDPEQSTAFDAALDEIMERRFSRELTRDERRFLASLTRRLLDRGGEVHDVLQNFARGLKQFVQSREYIEQRRMNRLLKDAQRAALAAREHIRPYDPLGQHLYLTSATIRSVDQLSLHDPSQDTVEGGITSAQAAEISLETVGELVAQSEIDFRRLEDHIRVLLATRDQVTIAEILAAFPAEQGLGSIVGYLALGLRNGEASAGRDLVAWQGRDSVWRQAWIPRVYFLKSRWEDLH